MSEQQLSDRVKEEIEYLLSLHSRRAARYQKLVAEGDVIAAQDYASDAIKHRLHTVFAEYAADPANHESMRLTNLNSLLTERDMIRLEATREQYEVIRRFAPKQPE